MKNGDEISAKVIEVETSVIKYKKCENLEGPTYTIEKSSVLLIKYANGTKDVFNESVEVKTEEIKTDEEITVSSKSAEPFSVISLVLSIIGLIVGLFASALVGLILLILAIIFGAIGIGRAKDLNLKGKGAAIAGLVIGIVGSLIFLIVMASL